MVCTKCKFSYLFPFLIHNLGEKKLDKVACPDVWKEGSRNTAGGKDGGRVVGANKLLEKKKFR